MIAAVSVAVLLVYTLAITWLVAGFARARRELAAEQALERAAFMQERKRLVDLIVAKTPSEFRQLQRPELPGEPVKREPPVHPIGL